MEFLLVIQFHETYFADQAARLAFEERLRTCMPGTCAVLEHESGGGTTNFFIRTKAPMAAHKTFRKYLGTNAVTRKVRLSYRAEPDGEFMNLWPFRDARPFALQYAPEDDPFRPASKRAIPKRSPAGVSKLVTKAAPPGPAKKTKRAPR